MIGIYDYDFVSQEKQHFQVPSLEAMKMAHYVKHYEKKTCMLLTQMSQVINCEKVYFFSNRPIDDIPSEFFFFDNIEFFGEYLANDVSKLVHHMRPDISIYKSYIQTKLNDGEIGTSKALSLLDSTYSRIKIGDEIISPVVFPRKKIYLYDKDFLANEDCWDILDNIIKKRPSSIYFIEPLQCRTIKQFLFLREEYEKVSRSNKIILDYFVPLHQLEVYFGKYKMKLLGEITKNSKVCIYMGKSYSAQAYNNTFYSKNLLYCLNLLFSYYSRNIPIGTEIYYPKLETDNPYIEIYKVINSWANSNNWDTVLINSFRSKKQKEVLERLLEKHPIMEPFFSYSKNKLKETRGIWRII